MNCDKCDRPIRFVRRWHDSYKPALLNEDWEEDDQMTWLEVAPYQFEPANHHQCRRHCRHGGPALRAAIE